MSVNNEHKDQAAAFDPTRVNFSDKFVDPRQEKILVVGVGGGGGNALNNIINSGLKGIATIAMNTDQAALQTSKADVALVLGRDDLRGLGAGNRPARGREAAEASREEIRELLKGADMVFVAAGMGGGTGTGAAPLVAEIAREEHALTVGIVTMPFSWEGSTRRRNSLEGLDELRKNVDALVVIDNNKLSSVLEKQKRLMDGFLLVDDVLRQAVSGVVGMITTTGYMNVDFADVRTIMTDSGNACMGIGEASGTEALKTAMRAAVTGPLVEVPAKGARGVLYFIECGDELSMDSITEAAQSVSQIATDDANIIWGVDVTPEMGDKVRVTLIATGFETEERRDLPQSRASKVWANLPRRTAPLTSQAPTAQPEAPRYEAPRPQGLTLSQADLVSEKDAYFGDDDEFDTPAINRRR